MYRKKCELCLGSRSPFEERKSHLLEIYSQYVGHETIGVMYHKSSAVMAPRYDIMAAFGLQLVKDALELEWETNLCAGGTEH